MPRPARSHFLIMMLSAAVAGLAGCSTDDDYTRVAHAPDGFSIVEVGAASGSVSGPGTPLTVTCREPLLIRVGPTAVTDDGAPDPLNYFELEGFTLQPPGACGTEVNCGWIELHVTAPGASTPTKHLSAQTVVRVNPPDPGGWQPGTYEFRAGLIDSDGVSVNGDNNQPARDDFSLDLVVAEPCATALQG